MNPPSLLGEGAERDGRDHTKPKDCDYSGKGNTMSKNFEQRLFEGGHWEKGNECLNLQDINKPPDFYEGHSLCPYRLVLENQPSRGCIYAGKQCFYRLNQKTWTKQG